MTITVRCVDNSQNYENCKRVGVDAYRSDINTYFHIDRHIPIINDKPDEYYVNKALDFVGRNGKTMKEEIEQFKTYERLPEPTMPTEEKKVSPMVGKELSL